MRAPKHAATSEKIRSDLLKTASVVNEFLLKTAALPSDDEFKRLVPDRYAKWTLYRTRPEKSHGFDFVSWPEGRNSFAISYRRNPGWYEYFDSVSGRTSLDDLVTVAF